LEGFECDPWSSWIPAELVWLKSYRLFWVQCFFGYFPGAKLQAIKDRRKVILEVHPGMQ
jgi:hypothetical protein